MLIVLLPLKPIIFDILSVLSDFCVLIKEVNEQTRGWRDRGTDGQIRAEKHDGI